MSRVGWQVPPGLDRLGDSRQASLLRHADRHPKPPAHREIFVNRTLRMETIRYVGFDLDWTLADYRRAPLERLTFELAIERLIAAHGFPERLRQLDFEPDFPRRGLLIDKEKGVVLRMNRHRFVGRAYVGRRRLPQPESIRLYRQKPLNPSSNRFYHVDSLFELPETNLYSELVELANTAPELGLPSPPELFDQVRSAIDWVHRDGVMKERILAEPERYLKRDPELLLALDRLALAGRRLLLITNSPWSYTDRVCSYLFDHLAPDLASWRDLFDLVVVDSAKPGFFRNGRPFVELDDRGELGAVVDTPSWGGVYSRGSLAGLMRLLDCPGEQVLYIGDHIYGDIVTSKTESTWRTALIVRELDDEAAQLEAMRLELAELGRLRREIAALGHEMDRLADMLALSRRLESSDEAAAETQKQIAAAYAEAKDAHGSLLHATQPRLDRASERFNRFWGSFFKQDTSKTLFAAQIERYACLYTSSVSNFSFYGTNHYFRVLRDPMKHERRGTDRRARPDAES